MSEYWIVQQDKHKQEKLAHLEWRVRSAKEEARQYRDSALCFGYVTALMTTLVGVSEYASQKWGIMQDAESIIGGLALCSTVLEVSLMRKSKKRAAEIRQAATNLTAQEITAEAKSSE